MNSARELLRHTIATVAYRGGKAVRDAPRGFRDFRLRDGTRTPGEILAHIGDLFDWALSLARGPQAWRNSKPLEWDAECARFFAALAALDAYLASDDPLAQPPEQIFQGPIADALTHIGQIAMLRRVAGAPVRGENYAKARIESGVVGMAQPAPRYEFD